MHAWTPEPGWLTTSRVDCSQTDCDGETARLAQAGGIDGSGCCHAAGCGGTIGTGGGVTGVPGGVAGGWYTGACGGHVGMR